MNSRVLIVIFALVVAALAALLYVLQAPGLQTEASSPGVAAPPATAEPPQCVGLAGDALERCRLQVWYASEPRDYEKGPSPEIDASATGARAARGSGVEGVTSSGVTTAPPR